MRQIGPSGAFSLLRTCECGIFYVCKVNGKKSYSCSCDIKETDDIRSGIYTQVNMFKKTKCYYLDKFFHPYNYEILDYFMLHLDLLSTCRIKIENERGCKKENKYINEDMDGDGDVWTFIAIVYLDIISEWGIRGNNKTTSDVCEDSYNIKQLFH